MLIANLFEYTITHSETGKVDALVKINGEHSIFNGHFPGQPVTPGVLQLQLVNELLNTVNETTMVLKTMGRCKFLAIWNPAEHQQIKVDLKLKKNEAGETSVSASGGVEGTPFFKFSATFK